MRIGFIGLGTMGARMAANLQKAGHQLIVNDVRRAAAQSHIAAGAVWADTPRQVGEQSEIVFTSLPAPPDVDAVALGKDGLIEGMRPNTAYFDLSTNSVAVMRHVHAVFAERGLHALDAPVSGGPQGAQSGKLAIWVGGEEEVFAQYRPVLGAMGDQVRYIGPIGSGTVAKLVHNCASAVINGVLAEVFTMGVKAGVDPLALWEAVRQGAAGRRRTFDKLPDRFLPGRYDQADFAFRLVHKDVSLAIALGQELHAPMPISSLVLQDMMEALNRGWADMDSSVFMQLMQERAGTPFKVEPERIRAAKEKESGR